MSEIVIEKIINNPVSSNCYVLYFKINEDCVVIDPGSKDSTILNDFLDTHQLFPKYIILTHHHFDHIWGVNDLIKRYKSQLISSRECSNKIVNDKFNLSLFYDDKGFTVRPSDILVEDIGYIFKWKGKVFQFYSTKGHTESCVSLLVDNYLFTGDALIKDVKIMTKFPGGNKEMLKETFDLYKGLLINNPNLLVHSGHGETFKLEDKYLQLKK